jgi:hypothetical protein
MFLKDYLSGPVVFEIIAPQMPKPRPAKESNRRGSSLSLKENRTSKA